ncbi:MAG: DUF1858 domain-containing protein [Clostridia bacterium]|nr:DUF1858 domain-containing protein [Clostridia bacterium]
MKTYSVNDQCIGCMACQRVAPATFEIINRRAVITHQPATEEENELAEQALAACPTQAIEASANQVVLATDTVRATLERYPFLKTDLLELSGKFKTLQNPVLWNSLARHATFEHAAKMTGVSICEILHFINKKLGLEQALIQAFPKCVQSTSAHLEPVEDKLTVSEAAVLQEELQKNSPEAASDVTGDAVGAGEPVLDVRQMTTDPFDEIIKVAYGIPLQGSFILVQRFKPEPLINMLSSMGFNHQVLADELGETKIRFTKTEADVSAADESDLPALTIQSATPVGYPIIMRLLQSKRLREKIRIKELKVWDETEKHLGWIVNKRADISFSAVITATKFKSMGVRMPAVFVWDNFILLTRQTDAKSMQDLKGETIHMPLFEDAPPAKITRYLLESEGLSMADFNFVYGEPFGRPKEIMLAFLKGQAQHVLLREPEASFTIAVAEKNKMAYSEISYSRLFNQANPGFGLFPNAGVIVKEELYEKYPEVMAVFTEELRAAIEWVKENPHEAAALSYDMMRTAPDHVERFINRVHFEYQSGEPLVAKMRDFYTILHDHGVLPVEVDQPLLHLFRS